MRKIETPVDYPDVLDTSRFLEGKIYCNYKLIGAVFHLGGLNGGHYTAAALDQPTDNWYYFNDSNATKIEKETAHSKYAYILFYQLTC